MDEWFSIEWIPKNDIYGCWNQYRLTDSWLMSKIYLFEAKFTYNRHQHNFRVRSL
jgi:hypothetical protein